MGIVQAPKPLAGPNAGPVAVEIVVPVYNEERLVESSIRKLRAYLDTSFPGSARGLPSGTARSLAGSGGPGGCFLVGRHPVLREQRRCDMRRRNRDMKL